MVMVEVMTRTVYGNKITDAENLAIRDAPLREEPDGAAHDGEKRRQLHPEETERDGSASQVLSK